MKSTKVKIELDRTRYLEFTWAAIDYICERYESMGKAVILASAITDNPMTITKDTIHAVIDMLTALLITDDPEITAEKVKELIPLSKMPEFTAKISEALAMGQDQNPPEAAQ